MRRNKYLTQQTDEGIRQAAAAVAGAASRPWQQALVVPACNESWPMLESMRQLCSKHHCLFILVLNEPRTAMPPCQLANQQLQQLVIERFSPLQLPGHAWLASSANLLMITRLGRQALDPQAGVGEARKLGNDLAALLHCQGLLESEWISNSDADASLPPNYFNSPLPAGCSAALHPYRYQHEAFAQQVYCATLAYDMRLEQYRLGLQGAGSRYAYTAHGSTLKIRASDYAAAHGFPRRAAAEDFYLLNKLNKLGGVVQLDLAEVQLQPRCSDRVPFGTGPAVSKLLQHERLAQAPLLYHPHIFQQLQQLIDLLQLNQPEHWARLATGQNMAQALAQLNPSAIARHLQPRWHNRDDYLKHLHNWLDAFRTLKFVQHQRRHGYADLSLAQWIHRFGEASLPAGHGQALRAAGSLSLT